MIVWLKRGNGYSMSVTPDLKTAITPTALIALHTPGGYQSFTVDRGLLVLFVEELNTALIPTDEETP